VSYIDVKYISMASASLQRFERKKDGLYNFRCPYCGDSQKRKDKARGYLFKIKNDYVYKCHNCGVGRTFTNFLKDNNQMLHDEYVMERYRDGLTGKNTQTKEPKFQFTKPVFKKSEQDIELQKISDLNISHPARQYLEQRKIEDLDYFFYCPKFKEWTNQQKETFSDMRGDSPRIILPLYTADKKLFGFQGRSLSKATKLRYITVILDENQPKLFGLDKVNFDETVYITEGPFDSTFIRNSIAMCGSDVHVDRGMFSSVVWVYDNEPRNQQIVERIKKTIDSGNSVVIWPQSILQKDINDMILAGHDVQTVVESNVYRGLEATLKLNEWKRV
jgi:predicted RNA-binding Zn-ribbon protein involved in translation (DUF1610 family)